MTECIITLKIGDKEIQKKVNSEDLPQSLESFRNIFNTSEWTNITKSVKETLQKRQGLRRPDLSVISRNPIPNTTVNVLQSKYPDVTFPQSMLDKKVLFVDSYVTETGQQTYGVYRRPDGEEIYVVDKKHIKNLSTYLVLLDSIERDNILESIPENYNIILDEILKTIASNKSIKDKTLKNIKDKKSLLLDFLTRKNTYQKYNVTIVEEGDGKSKKSTIYNMKSILTQISGDLFNLSYVKSFGDPLLDNIYRNVKWGKNFETASIDINKILTWINQDEKDIINKAISSIKNEGLGALFEGSNNKLKSFLESKIEKIETHSSDKNLLRTLFGEYDSKELGDKPVWFLFLNQHIKSVNNFRLEPESIKNGKILFNSIFPSLEYYGLGFNKLVEIKNISRYKGKYILQNEGKVYVTNYYPNKDQYSVVFNTLEEAKEYIDTRTNDEKLLEKYSFRDFHDKWYSEDFSTIQNPENKYNEGEYIEVLDSYGLFNPSERNIYIPVIKFLNKNPSYEQFKEFLFKELLIDGKYGNKAEDDPEKKRLLALRRREEILKVIDTPEKAYLFLKSLNYIQESERGDYKTIQDILKRIKRLKKSMYFVQNYNTYENGSSTLKIVKLKVTSTSSPKTVYNDVPMTLWKAAGDVLEKRLGVKLVIDTDFNNSENEDVKKAKAYITDTVDDDGNSHTEIHINLLNASSDDLFHEYGHIALAILKQSEDGMSMYRQLISKVWELGKYDLKRDEIIASYKSYSMESKMEEYFVSKFGSWATGRISSSEFQEVFGNAKFKETFKIFGSDRASVGEIANSSISTVFKSLSREISSYLEQNKGLMESSEFKNFFKLNRQKNKWIEEQIKNKKLKEDCKP